MYRSMRSSTQLTPGSWVRPSFCIGFGLLTAFLSRSPNNSTTIEILGLKIMRARYRWRWRCVSDTVIAAPLVQEPCLPTESIGQWTEPYTERRDPNSSKNVRLRTSHTSLLRLRVDHGPKNLSGRTLGGCPTGEARVTDGYNLPA